MEVIVTLNEAKITTRKPIGGSFFTYDVTEKNRQKQKIATECQCGQCTNASDLDIFFKIHVTAFSVNAAASSTPDNLLYLQ